MIYHVTSSSSELEGQFARFKVRDGIVVSAYFDGSIMFGVMTTASRPRRDGIFTGMEWSEVSERLAQINSFKVEEQEEVKPMPTNEKLALFCRLYEEFKKVKYTVSPADSGKMKLLQVTEPLLRYYLDDEKMPQTPTTWLFRGKQSITNLVRYQNEVRTSMTQGAPSKHPDHYSSAHEQKLDGPGITEYRNHLKSLGLVPKRARDGSILDYIKP